MALGLPCRGVAFVQIVHAQRLYTGVIALLAYSLFPSLPLPPADYRRRCFNKTTCACFILWGGRGASLFRSCVRSAGQMSSLDRAIGMQFDQGSSSQRRDCRMVHMLPCEEDRLRSILGQVGRRWQPTRPLHIYTRASFCWINHPYHHVFFTNKQTNKLYGLQV